jgi:hypothetical protein
MLSRKELCVLVVDVMNSARRQGAVRIKHPVILLAPAESTFL